MIDQAENLEVVKHNGGVAAVGNGEIVHRGGAVSKSDIRDLAAVELDENVLRFGIQFKTHAVPLVLIVVFVDLGSVCIVILVVAGEHKDVLCAAAKGIANAFGVRLTEFKFSGNFSACRIEGRHSILVFFQNELLSVGNG